MTSKAKFTQADVTRAIKGALAAEMIPQSIEIQPDGAIILVFNVSEDDVGPPLSYYINRKPNRSVELE